MNIIQVIQRGERVEFDRTIEFWTQAFLTKAHVEHQHVKIKLVKRIRQGVHLLGLILEPRESNSGDWEIYILKDQGLSSILRTLFHELEHLKQLHSKALYDLDDTTVRWYHRCYDISVEEEYNLPWEVGAREAEKEWMFYVFADPAWYESAFYELTCVDRLQQRRFDLPSPDNQPTPLTHYLYA